MELESVTAEELLIELVKTLRMFVRRASENYENGSATAEEISALTAAADVIRLCVKDLG